jgi:hypothetical protein
MLQDYSKFKQHIKQVNIEVRSIYNWWMVLILPAWVFVSFYLAQAIIIGFVWLLAIMNVSSSSFNKAFLSTLVATVVYVLTLAIVVFVPWIVRKHPTTKKDIGLTRLPLWSDIFITPAGLVIYFVVSSALILLVAKLLPWLNMNQVQNTGFSHLTQQYQYILAFITLVVIAPVAEEVLFRGYLFGKLKKYVPVWAAVLATSFLFGSVHGAWNLAVDTFALSIILCILRESTGSIWASILVHMTKNGIAFYILFISPLLLTTLGK